MKTFLKQFLTVTGLAMICVALAMLVPEKRVPEGGIEREDPKGESPGEARAAAGRTDEYDYDAPKPGTYELPVLQEASNGTVLGPDGRAVELHDLLDDRVAVLSFIYTRCSDPRACLRASGALSQLQQLSREDATIKDRLQLITLSFDPAYDTPEVMERYGRVFSRGEGGADWLFLTTRNYDELRPLLSAYGQRVDKRTKPSALGPYQHTLRVYLIDSRKRIRNIYSFGLLDPRLVMADVRTVLMEEMALARK